MIRRTEMTNNKSVWHRILLLIGRTSCCGIMLVGLFQGQYYPIIHSEGALLAFGFGIVYITCQALILYPVSRSSRVTSHLRMAMSLVTLISFIIMVTCKLMRFYEAGDERHCEMVIRVSEWILAFLYISNYTDFQIHKSLTEPPGRPIISAFMYKMHKRMSRRLDMFKREDTRWPRISIMENYYPVSVFVHNSFYI
ncbi:DNA damage-regulated autophagy modulator protein 1-like [Mixophyes fleayi]|uniref:DNA damage-regulated autophagy modulator protein 1-like n=1 Tax=Mixophyes fleayi TaxID=3061075 RepID=UPI003F4DD6C7